MRLESKPTILVSILAAVVGLAVAGGGAEANAYVISGGTPPLTYPAPGEALTNLSSGLYRNTSTDMALRGPMPITITRTYRSNDSTARAFGVGTTLNYDLYLYSYSERQSPPAYTDAEIILPDGGQVGCTCTGSNCAQYTTAVFQCSSNPDATFYGATISYNSNTPGWNLKTKHGTVYFFPLGAPLQSITDRHGNSLTITRDSSGDATEITSSNGRYVTIAYGDSSNPGQITKITDNSGRSVSYAYDSSHRLTSSTDALGNATIYYWSTTSGQTEDLVGIHPPGFNLTSGQYPQGVPERTITYDSSGRLQSDSILNILPSETFTTSFAYATNSIGAITGCDITDPNGNVRAIAFDSEGYVTSDTRAQGKPEQETTTFTRSLLAGDLITDITDALGRDTHYTYDSMGNILSITRDSTGPAPETTSYTYDPTFNQVTSITDPMNLESTITYDSSGNPIAVTDPAGDKDQFTYNAAGQVTSATDAMNDPPATFAYDASQDLASTSDPLGNTTTYVTDNLGRVTSVSDPTGATTSYVYDADDHVTTMTDAAGGVTQYAYSPAQFGPNGTLKQITDPNGNTMTFGARPILYTNTSSFCDALNRCEETFYDGVGNTVASEDFRGLYDSYTYDGLNRRTKASFNIVPNSNYPQSTITYTWDAGNRLTSAVDSVGGTITRTYDRFDRLASEVTPQGVVSYTYDADGRRTSMTVSGTTDDMTTDYTYDAASRLVSIGSEYNGRTNVSVELSYDADGRRTALALPYSDVRATYGYDPASRLTSLTWVSPRGPRGLLTYAYDGDGRRVAMGGDLATINLPAAASASYYANNLLDTWNGAAISGDSGSDMTSDPSNGATYKWDERGQLSSLTENGQTTKFRYDAFGRRWAVIPPSGTATTYLYDGDNIVQEQTGTTDIDVIDGLAPDEVFARTYLGADTMSLLTDALGSTIGWTSEDWFGGRVPAVNYGYEPFGATTPSGTTQHPNPYQFVGRENDGTGLYYMRARYYNPTLGRFISPDPALLAGGLNLFSYAGDDPINGKDATGKDIWGPGGICNSCPSQLLLSGGLAGIITNSPGGVEFPFSMQEQFGGTSVILSTQNDEVEGFFGFQGATNPINSYLVGSLGGGGFNLSGSVSTVVDIGHGGGTEKGQNTGSDGTRQHQKASRGAGGTLSTMLDCAHTFLAINAPVLAAVGLCTAAAGPAAPVSGPGCAAIVGGLLVPPTLASDYFAYEHCREELESGR